MKNLERVISPRIGVASLFAFVLLIATGSLLAEKQPSFAAHKEFSTGLSLGTPAQGDLNGDGITDLVIPAIAFLEHEQRFMVLLGNADASFQAPLFFDAGAPSGTAVVADFNGDGKNDVALTTAQGVSILLGNGKGGFGTPQIFAAGTSPAIVAGDFNGDKKIDLAVGDLATDQVSILLGNGDGTFQPARMFPVGKGPLGVAAGDFNRDGHLDLAVTDGDTSGRAHGNTVAILLGTGDGGFQPALFIPVAKGPEGVAVADLNHDGKLDVVVTNSATDQVSILLGNGNGSFQKPAVFPVTSGDKAPLPFQPSYVAVDDFQGNGNLDLVVSNPFASTASLLLGDGKGGFGKATNLLVATGPRAVLTGDYNHDGQRDFITSNKDAGTVSVFLGKGKGKFHVETNLPAPTRADQIILADFNEDGIPDFATANGGIESLNGNTASVYLSKKDGGKTERVFNVGINPLSVVSGDFNHDGHLDLVVANSGDPNAFGTGNLSMFPGNGDGTFQPLNTVNIIQPPGNFPRSPNFITVADFNHDGNLDIMACTDDQGGASLLPGDGKGGFEKPTLIHLNSACQQVLTADLNGDGEADLVFRLQRNADSPVVFVALGKGNGTFSTPQSFSLGDAFGIAVGDLNNDGIPDLLIAEPGAIETLLGDGHGKFTSRGFFLAPIPTLFHPSLIPALGDFNGDGLLDVAIADEFNQVTAILPGNGDGTLGMLQPFAGGGDESSAVTAGDLNGDGRIDLVLSGLDNRNGKGVLTVLRNNTR